MKYGDESNPERSGGLEQLDCIADHLIAKALGNNPVAIAVAHRRIEAGKSVTIEDCMKETEPGK